MGLRRTMVGRLNGFDERALGWVARRRPRLLVKAMRLVTHTADPSVVVAGLAAGLLLKPGHRATQAVAASGLAVAAASVIKRLLRRTRPSGWQLEPPDEYSMPSGHAAAAWSIAVTLADAGPGVAAVALTWAAAVSASRVVLGVHYPLDVVAGAALGAGAAAACLAANPADADRAQRGPRHLDRPAATGPRRRSMGRSPR